MSELLPFIVGGLAGGSIYAIAALGLVLTYKTTGIFNFAHGSVAAVAAYIFYDLWQLNGVPWPLAILLVLGVLAPAMGLFLEWLARALAPVSTAAKIVATIGLLVATQGALSWRFGSVAIEFPPFLPTRTFSIASVNLGADQLITMLVGLVASAVLAVFFTSTRTGRAMRAVVDNPDLLSLTGISPKRVQVTSWVIGSCFASLSGLLIAPTLGLDSVLLTLLVVQAFGAAAIGAFGSLPLTYVGGLVVGVGAAVSRKYVGDVPFLAGFPASFPFLVLFVVLLVLPPRRLLQVPEPPRLARTPGSGLPRSVAATAVAAGLAFLLAVPALVSTRLPSYNSGLVFVLVFASLGLLVNTSGQVSLCHLGFAAIGASTFAHAQNAGLPWLLSLFVAGAVAIPVGALVAIPSFRLSRLYLALATFGFGILLERLCYGTGSMFGLRGSLAVARPAWAQGDTAYYYLSLSVVLLGLLLVYAVNRARLGRLLRAMADSPVGLSTLGVDINVARLLVLCLSAFLAAIAGALLGGVNNSVSGLSFSSYASLLLLPVLFLAGSNQLLAPVLAAFSLTVAPSYFTGELFTQIQPIGFGIAAVVVAAASGPGRGSNRLAALAVIGRARTRHTLLGERIRRRAAPA